MGLVSAIAIGLLISRVAEGLSETIIAHFRSGPLVFVILFGMAVTLPTDSVFRAVQQPSGLILALLVNGIVLPLLAWSGVMLNWFGPFSEGFLILAAVPTTMASAAVWTRRASGNDAIPLIATLISNGLCFLTIPFWLSMMLGQSFPFDVRSLIVRLLIVAVLPMTLAQVLRRSHKVKVSADRYRTQIGMAAQIGILIIVTITSMRSGPVLFSSQSEVHLAAMIVTALACVILHGAALLVAWYSAKSIGLPPVDRVGIAFSGSQKTLPLAVEVATSPVLLASGLSPLAILPPLIFHAIQLVIDSALIAKFSQICSDDHISDD